MAFVFKLTSTFRQYNTCISTGQVYAFILSGSKVSTRYGLTVVMENLKVFEAKTGRFFNHFGKNNFFKDPS